MSYTLHVERMSSLPALAFAATFEAGSGRVAATCGPAVEFDDRSLIAGVWAGPFNQRGLARSATSAGTGLHLDGRTVTAVVGTASGSAMYSCRVGTRLVLSNSLAMALALAGDRLIDSYPFYTNDLTTIVFGSDRYRQTMPTAGGRLGAYYGSMVVGSDATLTPAGVALTDDFTDFASYRALLVREAKALFANAADPARRVRYRPLATLSAGYDSPAAAVIARDAGCGEGITFGQPHDRQDGADDSGEELGRMMGLAMQVFRTHAYRQRRDMPEIEFISSSFTGGQVYLATTGAALVDRVACSGFGGDAIWTRDFAARQAPHFPVSIGGYSQNEFYLRAPAIDFALPMIGARRSQRIGAISRSAAMQPWTLGTDYDRPIPRRILEEAGVPRGSFATAKRRATPDYDNYMRRTVALSDTLSPVTVAAFEAWFAEKAPLDPGQAKRHALVMNLAGRLLWSRKLRRVLAPMGIDWPPAAERFLRLKVPIRRNAFVFNWAVGEQVERYRGWLGI